MGCAESGMKEERIIDQTEFVQELKKENKVFNAGYVARTDDHDDNNDNYLISKARAFLLTARYVDNILNENDVSEKVAHQESRGGEIVDPDFRPDQRSLSKNTQWNNNKCEWKKFEDIMGDNIQIFEGKIEPADIKQGQLGDCYYLSSLAALSEYPRLIARLFKTKYYNKDKMFVVQLCHNGEFKEVALDHYIPSLHNQVAFSKGNGKEIWVCILEKAFAKVFGCYKVINGGICTDAIQNLTGAPGEVIKVKEKSLDDLWKLVYKNDKRGFIQNAGSEGQGEEKNARGIVSGHAYTILDVQQVGNDRIINLRNPWGQKEWNGDWSDKSSKWTPELRKKLNHTDSDDGSFWMPIRDFQQQYGSKKIDKYQTKQGVVLSIYNSAPNNHMYLSVSQPDERDFEIEDPNYRYKQVRMIVCEGSSTNIEHTLQGKFWMERDMNVEIVMETVGLYTMYVECDEALPLTASAYSKEKVVFCDDIKPVSQQTLKNIVAKVELPKEDIQKLNSDVSYYLSRIGGYEFIGVINKGSRNFKLILTFTNAQNFTKTYNFKNTNEINCSNGNEFLFFKSGNCLSTGMPLQIKTQY